MRLERASLRRETRAVGARTITFIKGYIDGIIVTLIYSLYSNRR